MTAGLTAKGRSADNRRGNQMLQPSRGRPPRAGCLSRRGRLNMVVRPAGGAGVLDIHEVWRTPWPYGPRDHPRPAHGSSSNGSRKMVFDSLLALCST